jgi:hypothetical protein
VDRNGGLPAITDTCNNALEQKDPALMKPAAEIMRQCAMDFQDRQLVELAWALFKTLVECLDAEDRDFGLLGQRQMAMDAEYSDSTLIAETIAQNERHAVLAFFYPQLFTAEEGGK